MNWSASSPATASRRSNTAPCIAEADAFSPGTLLQAALDYSRRGWSIIPVNGKLPVNRMRWKSYTKKLASEKKLREWFMGDDATGLAVLLGNASAGLCCRDFDQAPAYEQWAEGHEDLAARLPTAETSRGYHVYFQSAGPLRTETFGDGELRGDGSYCVLPPSRHPSGCAYRWVIPPPPSAILNVTIHEQAFLREAKRPTASALSVNNQSSQSSLATLLTLLRGRDGLHKALAEAAKRALPHDAHQNHKALFMLARTAKAIERELGRELSEFELRHAFDAWYQPAKPFLRPGKCRDDYWFEFLEGYDNVKHPLGEGMLNAAWAEAREQPVPSVAEQFESQDLRLLVALCRELQRTNRDKPFYVSCRTVAQLMRGVSHVTAAAWLRGLVRGKIIAVVEKGGPQTNRATRYRYLHPLEG